ncbi:fructosamine kinase family protein [Thiomicrorhabdus sp. 6S2-11]|uniref:Fructosamine kinase family protein n=1 Tax=Thiomicrorhabdus marina TaxID=2818442 RepID=A0ABS3Q4W4_9GAMM|nr:fructosamine kinase family protein [Thiomicrorhabdus marina]MBO1927307.1 fructosamine kinase family protein [Thiomicrorhabdus marina]
MNWTELAVKISAQLEQELEIYTAKNIAGGDISQAFKLHTNQGNFFLKTNLVSHYDMFRSEMLGLQTIADSNSILVPKAIASGTFKNHAWLLLDFVEMSSRGDDFQRGRDLALMHHHLNDSAKPFGWQEDNFIGLTPQRNDWCSNWIEFYGQMRLKPQIQMARERGISSSTADRGYQLIDKLDFWFQDYQPKASLLHGDLWGGNSAFNSDGDAMIFDPASYYGDHETDIAMTELFGGFSNAFYDGYKEVFPLDKGYAKRKNLYNLYHLLNHFNLFGGHYQQQADNMIQTLLAQAK